MGRNTTRKKNCLAPRLTHENASRLALGTPKRYHIIDSLTTASSDRSIALLFLVFQSDRVSLRGPKERK
jgi:hypothetical protein